MLQLASDVLSKNVSMYVLLLALVFWMYKEFRSEYGERAKSVAAKIEKALEAYGDLELVLMRCASGSMVSEEAFDAKLAKTYPYLPPLLLQRIYKWRQTMDPTASANLQKEVHYEVERLKAYQADDVSYKGAFSILDSVDYYYRNELKPFFQPAVKAGALLMLVAVGAVWLVGLIQVSSPSMPNFRYLAGTVSWMLWAMSVMATVDLIVVRRFRKGWLNWVLFVAFCASVPTLVLWHRTWWPFAALAAAVAYFAWFGWKIVDGVNQDS